ncbi:ABC transporter substrate-binding protein [Bradyrhizobium canariense]|uniref:ABC transporter substrate-binding protein n=1 Tax=Bradyrhizobium canariense TaxID=255045 RepID=UPI0020124259|nr:ABC transporter substrate-binding protein [Bradyrhizobium canariense]
MSIWRPLRTHRTAIVAAVSASCLAIATPSLSGEIVVGNTAPYSGPASGYAMVGKSLAAYFDMLNANGGVGGRTIKFLSYDDSYSPPKTVEQVRRLVESDEVELVLGLLGTPTNAAVQKYLNAKKVPQLFSVAASGKFSNPGKYPWTMGWIPTNVLEAKIFGKYILDTKPNAKIGVLYQNDDFGRDALETLKSSLGARAGEMIVSAQKYEVTDPTVDSQVVSMKSAGADVFYNAATVKFAAQAIKTAHAIGWKPLQLLTSPSSSINTVLKPAGIDASKDVVSALYLKEPSDPQWSNDPAMGEYRAWMKKYYANGDPDNFFNVVGYSVGQSFRAVLEACGNDVSRANIMAKASALNVELPMLLPGIKLKTSKTDYFPIQQLQLARFNGERWILFGEIIQDESEDVSAKD